MIRKNHRNDKSLFLHSSSLTNTFANLLGSGQARDANVFNKIIRKLPFSKNFTRGESARFFVGAVSHLFMGSNSCLVSLPFEKT